MGATEFIRRHAVRYSPVVLRGSLWIGIATVTELLKAFGRWKTQTDVTSLDFWQAGSEAALAGMIAWRTYLDQTFSRWQQERKTETDFVREQLAKAEPSSRITAGEPPP